MNLAPFACHPEQSKGRFFSEPESDMRTPHQRDRDRIIHSTAFRRLEYKTQVFVNHEGDHYRTRLTHSLEVSQISRSLCRNLELNEDLGEALALAHDLGHTPFGHAGEDGLAEVMKPYGGFSHNDQTVRIVTNLEKRYADFDGLNLTWEMLEGLIKHNGPIAQNSDVLKEAYISELDLRPESFASAEAQIAALADDIAYNNHDIDDGMRAGLFTVESLEEVPEIHAVFVEVLKKYPDITLSRQIHEAVRRLIHMMCRDVYEQAKRNIEEHEIKTADDIRALGKPLISFSPELQAVNKRLKTFLMERMYRHYRVNRMSSKARRVVAELFEFFLSEPECLPTEWRNEAKGGDKQQAARVVADYIAGMTDRYALKTYHQIFEVDKLG